MQERLLSLSEMATRLNRCTKTFIKYVDAYDIPHIRLGRDLLFDPVKVETYLENYHEKKRESRPKVRRRVAVRDSVSEFAGVLG